MLRLGCWLCLLGLSVPYFGQAATLYLDPREADMQVGEAIIMAVRIDVDEAADECINVVDAELSYSGTIQAVDTSVGNSIMQLWVEQPTIDTEAKTITFAGGIPNGYCGRIPGDPGLTNVVAEVILRHTAPEAADATTTAAVEFSPRTTVYLNDGSGAAAPLTTYGAEFALYPTVAENVQDPWTTEVAADTIPPQPFSISLERNDQIFDGEYYISFNTSDKQTGIAGYEVMEEPLEEQSLFQFGAVTAPWQEVRSPYQLQDQTLNSTIRVRATDKAGNEYVATLVPDPSLRTGIWTTADWLLLGAAGTALLFLVAFFGWRLSRRPSATNAVASAEYKHDPYDTHE